MIHKLAATHQTHFDKNFFDRKIRLQFFPSSIFLSKAVIVWLFIAACAIAQLPRTNKQFGSNAQATSQETDWQPLFDGVSLDGWKSSDQANSFSVHDGCIITNGSRSHLYYNGLVQNHDFTDFELRLEVLTQPNGNSGVYFHTEFQESGWPAKGYEIQINNSASDLNSRTGSLFAIQDTKDVVADHQWFTLRIRVEGKRIRTWVNDKLVTNYVEPADVVRRGSTVGWLIGHGTFALQAHDPESRVKFRNIEVRRLPPLFSFEVENLRGHPRLFADQARWNAVKLQIETDDVSQKIFTVIRETALQLLGNPPVEYVDKGAYWHGPMRQAQGRIMSLAMMYRLTGEARFLDRAKLEMRTLSDLPHWYPQHFLDTAEGALGLAVGIDWLHDSLTQEERDHFETALINNALRASLQVAEVNTWVSGNNNWTAVCHGGMLVAALSVAEREPELAKQIVNRALKHMRRYAELYAPAGAYSEGPDYWAYGTTFYALMVDALRTSVGTTCGLEDAEGFLQTADYTLQMTAPSGKLFNFADNGYSLGVEPIQFWFARELQREDLLNRELTNIKLISDAITSGAPRGDASRMLPLALLWRDPAIKAKPAPSRPLRWWSQGGSQPQAVMRSGWDDPRATFVGIKAGIADDSHAHMDIGSFIFEAKGVRWAVDLGRESYPHARANGIPNAELFGTKQDSKRWSIFRCGADSHNLLRFNDAPQRVDRKAEITPTENGFSVDLSPVVVDQIKSALRHFSLNPDRSFTIRDTWSTGEGVANVSWQWITYAAATKTDDGFLLKQYGETLRLVTKSDSKLNFEIEDASEPRNKFDSPNPGLSRLRIQLETLAGSKGWIEVTASTPE